MFQNYVVKLLYENFFIKRHISYTYIFLFWFGCKSRKLLENLSPFWRRLYAVIDLARDLYRNYGALCAFQGYWVTADRWNTRDASFRSVSLAFPESRYIRGSSKNSFIIFLSGIIREMVYRCGIEYLSNLKFSLKEINDNKYCHLLISMEAFLLEPFNMQHFKESTNYVLNKNSFKLKIQIKLILFSLICFSHMKHSVYKCVVH